MVKKSKWITIVKHPKHGICIEHGKVHSEEIYNFDEKKKDFINIGWCMALKYMLLPKLMTYDEMQKYIRQSKEIKIKCDELSH